MSQTRAQYTQRRLVSLNCENWITNRPGYQLTTYRTRTRVRITPEACAYFRQSALNILAAAFRRAFCNASGLIFRTGH